MSKDMERNTKQMKIAASLLIQFLQTNDRSLRVRYKAIIHELNTQQKANSKKEPNISVLVASVSKHMGFAIDTNKMTIFEFLSNVKHMEEWQKAELNRKK